MRPSLPPTHVVRKTREKVTALSQPHRHNGGTRLVLTQRGEVRRMDDRDLEQWMRLWS